MARVLLLYLTRYGATERIAERIDAVLSGSGHVVTRCRLDALPDRLTLGEHDRVIVAAAVYLGRYAWQVRRFVDTHVADLNRVGSAFVSVCGAAAPSKGASAPEAARTARRYPARLLADTGWRPDPVVIIAGAVAYTRYGWLTRWVMRRINRSQGRETDTSRDWSYTDWGAVERFARDEAARAGRSRGA